jgi:hypothetical protein
LAQTPGRDDLDVKAVGRQLLRPWTPFQEHEVYLVSSRAGAAERGLQHLF